MKKNYTFGLDIGMASVGWSVVAHEEDKIMDRGVRTFTSAENPKNQSSLAKPRREKRITRRRLRRRKWRLLMLKQEFESWGWIKKNQDLEKFYNPERGHLKDPWTLRKEALDRKLSGEELARVFTHIASRRGFKSSKKAESKDSKKKKEEGKLLQGVKENEALLKEKGYRTMGEMYVKDPKFSHHKRNKKDEYTHTACRVLLEEEARTIFQIQRNLGNPLVASEREDRYLVLFNDQKEALSGDQILNMLGSCSLEPEEKRAAKVTITAELFTLMTRLLNTRVGTPGKYRSLTGEEIQTIKSLAFNQAKVTYLQVRKALGLKDNEIFKGLLYTLDYKTINHIIYKNDSKENPFYPQIKEKRDFIPQVSEIINKTEGEKIKEKLQEKGIPEKIREALIKKKNNPEKGDLCKLENYQEIRKIVQKASKSYWEDIKENRDLLDEIGTLLSLYKTDEDLKEKMEPLGLPPEVGKALLELSFDKFLHLSLKALKKILPFMEKGLRYDEACQEAGYHHSVLPPGEKSRFLPVLDSEDVRNPVVFRALSQTRKVVNALVRRYGSPQFVRVEVLRDLGRSASDRKEIQKGQTEYRDQREAAKKQFQEMFHKEPRGQDILKFRLHREQNGSCPYSGKYMEPQRLLEPGYVDVDHIVPYSRSFDDSLNNKVLCLTKENRNKRERLPFEYLGAGDQDSPAWRGFKDRCKHYKSAKKNKLFKLELTEEDEGKYKASQMNDSRYIARFILNHLRENLTLSPPPEGKKRQVYAVKGGMTGFLRTRWGLNHLKYQDVEFGKERKDDRNHALDALIVACATQDMVQKLSTYSRKKELYPETIFDLPKGQRLDRSTGESVSRDQKHTYKAKKSFPQPWDTFREEVLALFSKDPLEALRDLDNRDITRKYALDSYPESSPAGEGIEEGGEENPAVLSNKNLPPGLRPLFVSRMPTRRVRGLAHEETIRSKKILEKEKECQEKEVPFPPGLDYARGMSSVRRPIENIKLKDLDMILGSQDGGEKTPLYKALQERLEAHGDDPKKAFAQPVYKGDKRGFLKYREKGKVYSLPQAKVLELAEQGRGEILSPRIKSVKLMKKQNTGVNVRGGIANNGKMIRVDVFHQKEQYWLVPVYTKDRLGSLPQKAIVRKALEEEWEVMDDKSFCFSLYPNDLVKMKFTQKETIFGYYCNTDRSKGSFTLETHDRSWRKSNLNVSKAKALTKFQIDILGEYYPIKKECRRLLSRPGQRG